MGLYQLAYAAQDPLTVDNVWDAIEAMRKQTDVTGNRPFGADPSHILVSSALEKEAMNPFMRGDLGDTGYNTLFKRVTPNVTDWLRNVTLG